MTLELESARHGDGKSDVAAAANLPRHKPYVTLKDRLVHSHD